MILPFAAFAPQLLNRSLRDVAVGVQLPENLVHDSEDSRDGLRSSADLSV